VATITKRILIWGLAALFTAATVAADDSEPLNEHCHYEHVGFWGSEGAGDGQFDHPAGIAVSSDGTVYVADDINNRIQYFSCSGSFLGKWGERGIGDPGFNYPGDVAIAPNGDVYVVDSGMLRLKYFSSDGFYKGGWEKATRHNTWVSLDVGPNGDVYVVDLDADLVRRFSPEGEPLGEWHSDAVAVTVAPNGNVYDADPIGGITYYTYTGAFLGRWNSEKDEVQNLERPYEIAIGPDGTVFVADYVWEAKYSRVELFTLTGKLLGELSLEDFTGLNAIGGLAVGPDGTVYVTETNNHRVHYFRRVDRSE
jgi:tripartite motif-containing protein 71